MNNKVNCKSGLSPPVLESKEQGVSYVRKLEMESASF